MSWAFQRTLSEQWLPGADVVPVEPSLRTLRSAKQVGEVERIRRAAAITDGALAAVLVGGLVGRREAELAWDIEGHMRDGGAERAGYDLSWRPDRTAPGRTTAPGPVGWRRAISSSSTSAPRWTATGPT